MYWQDATEMLQQLFDYERVGLISDMDGTLSPIVPVPSDAAPTERNRDLLQQLHQHLALVAVVSGRAADDVRERVGLPELVYAGNHGLERWNNGEVQVAPAVQPYLSNLQAAIEAIKPQMPDGMWIEDKGATLSLHYRDVQNPAESADDFQPTLERIAGDHDLRVFRGRMIFELRPPLDMDKGTVFKQLIDEYDLEAALYTGDDTTDADALHMAQQLRRDGVCYSLAIGVESDETPDPVRDNADMMTRGVDDVEELLGWLLNCACHTDE
jgi:trehalose 6-phosphate phosphatase